MKSYAYLNLNIRLDTAFKFKFLRFAGAFVMNFDKDALGEIGLLFLNVRELFSIRKPSLSSKIVLSA